MSLFRFLMALFVFGIFQSTFFAPKEKIKKNLSSSQPSSRQEFELSPEGVQYYMQQRANEAADKAKKAADKENERLKREKIIANNAPKIAAFHQQEQAGWVRLTLEETAKNEARSRETLAAKKNAAMAAIKRAEKKAFQALQESNNNASQRALTSKPKKKIEAAQDFEKSRRIVENQETQQKQEEISDDEFLRSVEILKNLRSKASEQQNPLLDSLAEEMLTEPSPAPVQIQERPRRPKKIKDPEQLLGSQESVVQSSEGEISPLQLKQRRRPRVQQNLEKLSTTLPLPTELDY